MIDNLHKIVRHVDDVNVFVVYTSSVNGSAFNVSVVVTNLTTLVTYNIQIGTISGGNKEEVISIPCDFSSIPPGDGYKLEVLTDVSVITDGILARGALVVLNKDGYSI